MRPDNPARLRLPHVSALRRGNFWLRALRQAQLARFAALGSRAPRAGSCSRLRCSSCSSCSCCSLCSLCSSCFSGSVLLLRVRRCGSTGPVVGFELYVQTKDQKRVFESGTHPWPRCRVHCPGFLPRREVWQSLRPPVLSSPSSSLAAVAVTTPSSRSLHSLQSLHSSLASSWVVLQRLGLINSEWF